MVGVGGGAGRGGPRVDSWTASSSAEAVWGAAGAAGAGTDATMIDAGETGLGDGGDDDVGDGGEGVTVEGGDGHGREGAGERRDETMRSHGNDSTPGQHMAGATDGQHRCEQRAVLAQVTAPSRVALLAHARALRPIPRSALTRTLDIDPP